MKYSSENFQNHPSIESKAKQSKGEENLWGEKKKNPQPNQRSCVKDDGHVKPVGPVIGLKSGMGVLGFRV